MRSTSDLPAGDARRRSGRAGSRRRIGLVDLGRGAGYRDTLELQRRLARERIAGEREDDLLLLVEHGPVLTVGRGAEPGHLSEDRAELRARGVDVVEIERGGDVTYHGPGQLVGYPILDLAGYRKDLHWYVRTLEAALVSALSELGLPAFRVPDHTGVWVGERRAIEAGPAAAILAGRIRKVASIGVHVSRWVTWHGFALNVTDEPLENFRLIVPCGIEGVRMTSLASEGIVAGPDRVREAVAAGFAAAFDVRVEGATGTDAAGDGDAP